MFLYKKNTPKDKSYIYCGFFFPKYSNYFYFYFFGQGCEESNHNSLEWIQSDLTVITSARVQEKQTCQVPVRGRYDLHGIHLHCVLSSLCPVVIIAHIWSGVRFLCSTMLPFLSLFFLLGLSITFFFLPKFWWKAFDHVW